jgi:hypothetical protein
MKNEHFGETLKSVITTTKLEISVYKICAGVKHIPLFLLLLMNSNLDNRIKAHNEETT